MFPHGETVTVQTAAASGGGEFVDQQNSGPFGVRFSSSSSDGDVWFTSADKLALRPHRLGGGLRSVGLVGARYEITPDA